MSNLKEHFPYPDNPLNEGRASLADPQNSEIIAADAAILNGVEPTEPIPVYPADVDTGPMPVITEPLERRFTAPSIGGGIDVKDRSADEQRQILNPEPQRSNEYSPAKPNAVTGSEALDRADVGMIDLNALRGRLAEAAAKQMAGRVGRPMHIDGRIPGQVPSVNARPHVPAGAKPSRLAEMHKQYGTER